MNEKVKKLRDEARKKLELAQEIASADEVTDEMADQVEALSISAKDDIDRAEKLIVVLEASAELDWEDEDDDKSNGSGKVVEMGRKAKVKAARERYGLSEDTHDFKSFRDYLKAVGETTKGRSDRRLKYGSQKDMTEGSMAAGGALVPPGYLAEVLSFIGESSIVLPRANVIQMTGRDMSIPALDCGVHAASGKSNFYGGVLAYWIEEAGEKEIENITFDKIELVVHKLCGYTRVSDELMNDSSPSVSSVIARAFAGAVGWRADYCFLAGNGVGQPLGVIGAPGTFTQVRVLAGAFGFLDAVNMVSHFLPEKGGVWVMNHSLKPSLFSMVDGTGAYIWAPHSGAGAKAAGPATLLGFPILWTEKTPILGNLGDVLLCDFSQYLVGMRQDVRLEASIHERFRHDQTAFRMVMRVDGQEWLKAPIVTADGTTQLSPFVELSDATP